MYHICVWRRINVWNCQYHSFKNLAGNQRNITTAAYGEVKDGIYPRLAWDMILCLLKCWYKHSLWQDICKGQQTWHRQDISDTTPDASSHPCRLVVVPVIDGVHLTIATCLQNGILLGTASELQGFCGEMSDCSRPGRRQVRWSQAGRRQVRWSQAGRRQVRWSQAGRRQVRWSQVKFGQVKHSCVLPMIIIVTLL